MFDAFVDPFYNAIVLFLRYIYVFFCLIISCFNAPAVIKNLAWFTVCDTGFIVVIPEKV